MLMKNGISYGLLCAMLIVANPMSAEQQEGLFEHAKARFFASKTVNNVQDRYHEWQRKRKDSQEYGVKDALQQDQSPDTHAQLTQSDQSNILVHEEKESKLGRNVAIFVGVIVILFFIGWKQENNSRIT